MRIILAFFGIFCFVMCASIGVQGSDSYDETSPLLVGHVSLYTDDVYETGQDLEELTPFLKQLGKDIFPEKETRCVEVGKNGLALFLGANSAYILSILFANNGVVGNIFNLETEGSAIALGLIIAALHLPAEIKRAKKNIDNFKHWFQEEKGLRKEKSAFVHVIEKGIWLLGVGLTAKMLRLYLDIGFQGGADWVEFFICIPPFFLQTLGKNVHVMQTGFENLRYAMSGEDDQSRADILASISDTYRMVKNASVEKLLEMAETIALLAGEAKTNPNIISPLLYFLCKDADDKKACKSAPYSISSIGYSGMKALGGVVGLCGWYGFFLSGEFVMANTLGLVNGTEYNNYVPDWNAGQDWAVYSYAILVGAGFTTISAMLSLKDQLAKIYSHLFKYDPNDHNKVLERHETTSSGVRAVLELLCLPISGFLSMPSASLTGTGAYLEGIKNMDNQIPMLVLSALGYGSILNQAFSEEMQDILTDFVKLTSACCGECHDIEEQLRHYFYRLLFTLTEYVKILSVENIKALQSFLNKPNIDEESTFIDNFKNFMDEENSTSVASSDLSSEKKTSITAQLYEWWKGTNRGSCGTSS
jgi:hypothetical protein